MIIPLFKFYIDFEDKRKVRKEMIEEDEEKVKEYISNKYKTDKFKITRDKEMGSIIKWVKFRLMIIIVIIVTKQD